MFEKIKYYIICLYWIAHYFLHSPIEPKLHFDPSIQVELFKFAPSKDALVIFEPVKSEPNKLLSLKFASISEDPLIFTFVRLSLVNLDFSKFQDSEFFYDVIYNPKETNFLKDGKKLGKKTENGKKMFIYQAAKAFKIWHGIEPKVDEQVIGLLDKW